MINLKYTIAGISLLLLVSQAAIGQDCRDIELFKKNELGDFDYRGQTTMATVLSGDTAKVKIVVYAAQLYRIMVRATPNLGEVSYKIIDEVKRFQKEVKEVKESEIPVYKIDEEGNPILNEWGEYIVDRNEIQRDTIWTNKKYIDRKVLFDSKKDAADLWETFPKKTRVYVIETIIPKSDVPTEGCAHILVGFKSFKKNR